MHEALHYCTLTYQCTRQVRLALKVRCNAPKESAPDHCPPSRTDETEIPNSYTYCYCFLCEHFASRLLYLLDSFSTLSLIHLPLNLWVTFLYYC